MKKSKKKLQLDSQTMRTLQVDQLTAAVGGLQAGDGINTCCTAARSGCDITAITCSCLKSC